MKKSLLAFVAFGVAIVILGFSTIYLKTQNNNLRLQMQEHAEMVEEFIEISHFISVRTNSEGWSLREDRGIELLRLTAQPGGPHIALVKVEGYFIPEFPDHVVWTYRIRLTEEGVFEPRSTTGGFVLVENPDPDCEENPVLFHIVPQ
ncbi:MAG: hypothetical protein FWC79_08120 [Oscillospiraceae bacterium]|nr:hypothetical protein [Oscillospiraceae bacterium]